MEPRNIPWKAEWKAAGLDPGPLNEQEAALVPELERENAAFLERHPSLTVVRPQVRAARPFVWGLWALPVAAALVLVLAWPGSTAPSSSERLKGADAVVTVYRQNAAGVEKLGAGAVVRPGDVLQASYRVGQPEQGVLVSVDGNGNVTVHMAKEGRSVPLAAGPEHPLEFSYELDRAPRYEVFLLVVSDRAFDVEPIRQVLKATAWADLKPNAFGPAIRFVALPLTKELSR